MLRKDFRVANPEWGTKRACDKCAARFYDLNRAPVVCPKCGTHHVDKPLTKASAGAKTPQPEPPTAKPKVNDKAEQAVDATETDDDDDHEEEAEEEDIDTASEDEELIEDVSDLAEDADDVADAVDIRDDADPAKE